MTEPLTYSVVTPARNEAGNLRRLAGSIQAQTRHPRRWLIVDNGSTDETGEVGREIASGLEFADVLLTSADNSSVRGGPIVAAFHAGLDALEPGSDVVVKLDADVSFAPDFFDRLLGAFEADPGLGIAGGICYEQDVHGAWSPTYTTRDHVRGATRAYRAACLAQVLPLEQRMGWDGVDELKAQVEGWHTRTIADLPFYHHRVLGARERAWSKWVGQGDMAHFMGYRFDYLLARAAYRSLREPTAVGMVWGYLAAAASRSPRQTDPEVRQLLRSQQSLTALPRRIREALGRAEGAGH
jgi:glycosyltransferase involved in cell wall biosynthesis